MTQHIKLDVPRPSQLHSLELRVTLLEKLVLKMLEHNDLEHIRYYVKPEIIDLKGE